MAFFGWLLGSAVAGAVIGTGLGIWIAGWLAELKRLEPDEARSRRRTFAWICAVIGAVGICVWVMLQVLGHV